MLQSRTSGTICVSTLLTRIQNTVYHILQIVTLLWATDLMYNFHDLGVRLLNASEF
jgi:hypothetical protein